MKCNRPALAAALLALLAPLHLAADIFGVRPLPPQPASVVADAPRNARLVPAWPRPAPPPLLRVVPRQDDDSPGRWLQVHFPAAVINLDAERLDDWLRLAQPSVHQLVWINRWSPSVHLGLSQAPATVLPNLSDPAWDRYLAALRREWGRQLKFVVDDDSQRNTDMTRVLGVRTRVVVFDVTLPALDDSRQRHINVAIERPGGVIVFACYGSTEKLASMDAVFERLVNRAEDATEIR